jgi:hypothetical protein
MAIIKNGMLHGKLGDLYYYTGKNGEARTKEWNQLQNLSKRSVEFKHAIDAVNYFTAAFSPIVDEAADVFYDGRLLRQMLLVLRSDTYAPRGARTIMDGDMGYIERFECNSKQPLPEVIRQHCEVSCARRRAEVHLHLDSFNPASLPQIYKPDHYSLYAMLGTINFDTGKFSASKPVFVDWPPGEFLTPEIDMKLDADGDKYDPWFLLVGFKIVPERPKKKVRLYEAGFHALHVLRVSE